MAQAVVAANGDGISAVRLEGLKFSYPGCAASIKDASLDLPRGSRCLLIGANGAGKTTLLQLLAGKYMVGRDVITVLGRSPFHDLQLTCSGQLSYLGTSWRKDVAFAGYGVPLQGDITAGKMIFGVEGVDPERRAALIRLLDVDLYQRLTTMSDGQRRRVQICMGLLKPYDVLLMDEITVDMDVLGRQDLLDFFRSECEERGATIVYATHIFDGLEGWVTHVAYLEDGEMRIGGARSLLPQLSEGAKLLNVVEVWLRKEKQARQARDDERRAASGGREEATPVAPSRTPFDMPSKHLAFFR
ncbi:P-loop containing nucleoside triphosphate hydrolase [Raphidocelis subcapitata]|uniref:P-loop containing nucleoside triphosphate hydrolase n=1 Tax=Raphidocelis subcapitata TaxID=307507 RepID=A0A2V0P4J3_9CHLO|nr:P-loop containing nucleoside triphosphate hydrolase [Raphidocelis subcapitata]|eukprot:GBF94489.1 P-loop containing nucleoside triphosphate hydrolase [Raphidocelis subcapitata]